MMKLFVKNRIKIKPRTLRSGYHDYIDILPHVMFEVLQRFVEEECGPDSIVDWDGDEQHRAVRKEFDELLDWWKWFVGYSPAKERKEQLDECGHRFVKIKIENGLTVVKQEYNSPEHEVIYRQILREIGEEEERLQLQLEEKLKRIVELRGWMWT